MSASIYPVAVDAQLDPRLNRGLWLVKWLLAIPHYLILAVLWLAFVVLSVAAFFSILFTGRYPRSIFDFNVGVLRWSWRVAYYAYGTLGTDRYPPFSLQERADYPAHLEVAYPQQLSRGLVLVKWWLLAIPHYLVVGFLVGGGWYIATDLFRVGGWPSWSGGLIGLLVLVAAVALLFTGKYPEPIFDLVLGLNRWVLRVAAYAGLMTDEYPPFRLDQGGQDPGHALLVAHVSSPADPAIATDRPSTPTVQGDGGGATWTAGRIVAVVAGSLLLAISLGSGLAGAALLVGDRTMRDASGFLMSRQQHVATATYALTSTPLMVHTGAPGAYLPESILGQLKVTATPDRGQPVFLGIATTDDAARYLQEVGHATITRLGPGIDPVCRTTDGHGPALAPTDTDIWVAYAVGSGTQTVIWPIQDGTWTLVMMNADGSAGVTAGVAGGATVPALAWLIALLLSFAAITFIVGVVVLVLALRSPARHDGG